MPDAAALDALADELLGARQSAAVVDPPSRRHPGFSLADGYAVAQRLEQRRVAGGARVVGAKLGFTSEALWSLLGVSEPFWAPLYDDTVTEARTVSLAGLVEPRLEPEIVVGLRQPLSPGATPDEVAQALGWAALGFELAQCRYPGWAFAAGDAVADGGLHGLLVVGDRVELDPAAAAALSTVELELSCDGAVLAGGRATDVLGGPLEVMGWLLRLPGVAQLPAGTVVTTGSITAPAPVEPGQTWRAGARGPVGLGELEIVIGARPGAPVQSPS